MQVCIKKHVRVLCENYTNTLSGIVHVSRKVNLPSDPRHAIFAVNLFPHDARPWTIGMSMLERHDTPRCRFDQGVLVSPEFHPDNSW